jgi:hypothetical protein
MPYLAGNDADAQVTKPEKCDRGYVSGAPGVSTARVTRKGYKQGLQARVTGKG